MHQQSVLHRSAPTPDASPYASFPVRVLIVEDSSRLREAVARGLRHAGYAVDAVADGLQGLIHAKTSEYDVVILDLMLPEMDGLTVMQRLRSAGNNTHVLILTARDTVNDRIRGLRAGADDYLVKPFNFDELLARIEALTRRRHGVKTPVLAVEDLKIDTATRQVTRGAAHIDLTPREYAILEYLAFRAGCPVTRSELEEHIYDEHRQVMSNAVDSAVCSLRSKLSIGGRPGLIHTRRGFGYVLTSPDLELTDGT